MRVKEKRKGGTVGWLGLFNRENDRETEGERGRKVEREREEERTIIFCGACSADSREFQQSRLARLGLLLAPCAALPFGVFIQSEGINQY